MTRDSSGGADAKSYILVSQLPPDLYEKYVVDLNTAYMSGFTFVIISIVHLAGGKIPEGMIEVSNMILIYNYIHSFMHLLYLWKANIRFRDLHFSRVIKICDVTELDMV
jgi:hypothetical protein